jgi:hypothetical protein
MAWWNKHPLVHRQEREEDQLDAGCLLLHQPDQELGPRFLRIFESRNFPMIYRSGNGGER